MGLERARIAVVTSETEFFERPNFLIIPVPRGMRYITDTGKATESQYFYAIEDVITAVTCEDSKVLIIGQLFREINSLLLAFAQKVIAKSSAKIAIVTQGEKLSPNSVHGGILWVNPGGITDFQRFPGGIISPIKFWSKTIEAAEKVNKQFA